MSTAEPSPSRRLPLRALAALALLAVGGACRRSSDAPTGPAGPIDLAREPILWARSEVSYEDFRAEPLRALHAELVPLLGEPLLLRVVPYFEEQPESEEEKEKEKAEAEPRLLGETLEIFYQETRSSADALRRHADRTVRRVQAAFPHLDENDHVLIHARLPDGTLVSDLDSSVTDVCGARNAVRADILPSAYEPGALEALNFVLCDGPAQLDARLQDPDWPLIEDNWSTDDRAR